jgi:putative chitinase
MNWGALFSAILGAFKRAPAPMDGTNGNGYQPVAVPGPAPSPPAPVLPPVVNDPPPMPTVAPARQFALTSVMLADAVDITQARALPWVGPLTYAMTRYSIDTPARAAAFIAQLAHESVKFAYTKEIWGPTAAQRAYEPPGEKATDLGNTQPGDGLRFCGRGLIQITGRANYQACGKALALDLIANPDLLEQATYAASSAGWFWNAHGLNAYADRGDFLTLTKRINGGTNGLADRQALWASCKSAFGA